jgi:hypothetical protein
MNLTPFEWLIILAALAFMWFLFRRDFQSRDALSSAVINLSVEVAALPGRMGEKFMSKVDCHRDMDRLEVGIKEIKPRYPAPRDEDHPRRDDLHPRRSP